MLLLKILSYFFVHTVVVYWCVFCRQSKVLEMVEKNYRIHCSIANTVRINKYLSLGLKSKMLHCEAHCLAFSALTLLVEHQEGHPACRNWWAAGLVICLEQVQTICIWSSWRQCHHLISCFIKIHIGLTFLLPPYPGCTGKEVLKRVSLSVCCLSVCLSV